MEPFDNPDEGLETSSAKVVTGVRTQPELKMELTDEAGECGMSTSEYCEMILLNRHKEKAENERLKELVAVQQKEIEQLKAQMAGGAIQLEVVQAENEQLRKKTEEQGKQLAVYSDKRFLYIYANVKGKKDIVENAYGDNFEIIYDTPDQVLLAWIYSSKLNH